MRVSIGFHGLLAACVYLSTGSVSFAQADEDVELALKLNRPKFLAIASGTDYRLRLDGEVVNEGEQPYVYSGVFTVRVVDGKKTIFEGKTRSLIGNDDKPRAVPIGPGQSQPIDTEVMVPQKYLKPGKPVFLEIEMAEHLVRYPHRPK